MSMNYLFSTSDGIVRKNTLNLPIDALSYYFPNNNLIFRFIFDDNSNTLWIQDPSFQKLMISGNEEAWNRVNQALKELYNISNKKFPTVSFNDPINSGIIRKLSDYKKSWNKINDFINDEYNINAFDIKVYEYIPTPERINEKVLFLPKGTYIGNELSNEPMIGINRRILIDDDVSMDFLGEELLVFYLNNIKNIAETLKTKESLEFLEKINYHDNPIFAIRHNDKIRIFKSKDGFTNEELIKSKLKTYQDKIHLFNLDNSNNSINSLNSLPSEIPSDIIDAISNSFSIDSNTRKSSIILSFDPSLGKPFVTSINKSRPIYDLLIELFGKKIEDIKIIKSPISNNDITAYAIKSIEDEDSQFPGLRNLRSSHGIIAEYPFIAINSRKTKGNQLRGLIDSLSDILGTNPNWIKPTDSKLESIVLFLFRIGFSKKDILDLLSNPSKLSERAEFSSNINNIINNKYPEMNKFASIMLGVNNWWWPSSQEGLNKKPDNFIENENIIPLNPIPKGKRFDRPSLEILLNKDHDELSAQKPMEILLEESRNDSLV